MSEQVEDLTRILEDDADDEKATTEDVEDVVTDPENDDSPLNLLVGEGRKFKDADAVAKGYLESQKFIETLKREKRELEERMKELATRSRLEEEILEELKGMKSMTKEEPNVDIATEVLKVLKAREEAERVKRNKETGWQKLVEITGDADTAKLAIKKYVGGDEGKREALEILWQRDPDAFVRLIAATVEVSDNPGAVLEPSKKNTQPETINTGKLTWSKARAIKKENPDLFWSMKFQRMLHEAANNNPNFFDT